MPDEAEKRYSFTGLADRKITSASLTFLWNHLCKSCQKQKIKSNQTGKELVHTIVQHCSKELDYIDARTPVAEAVIKVILSARNRGLSTDQIVNELKSRWAMTAFPRPISSKIIARLITSIDGLD